MYSITVEKRGLIAYDDKRVLLNDLTNGQQNPNTHANGHYSLVNDIQVEEAAEPAAAGNDFHIVKREQRTKPDLGEHTHLLLNELGAVTLMTAQMSMRIKFRATTWSSQSEPRQRDLALQFESTM